MSIALMQMRTRLAECQEEYKRLDVEASAQIIAIQTTINPYERDVTRLRTGEASVAAARLHEVVTRMRELQQEIERLKHDLK